MISQEAYQAAQKHLQGVPENGMLPAISAALSSNPNLSLTQLITAHKLLTQQQQQQQQQQAVQQAQQGGGQPGQPPQPTTVAQDVQQQLSQINPQLEEQVMSSAAQPARQGGIAGLDTGDSFGQTLHAAQGGIIAFSERGEVPEPEGDEKQQTSDRKAVLDTVKRLGAAGLDIATLPGRGLAGAFESAVTRPLRAVGVPIPYLPKEFYGGDASSMTPYYDKIRAEDAAPAPVPTPAPPSAEEYVATGGPRSAPAAPTRPTMIAPSNAPVPVEKTEAETSPAMKKAWDAVAAQQAKSDKMFASIKAPQEMTRGQSDTAAEERYNAALARNGIDPNAHKERGSQLKEQATQARQDRDVDLYMAAAQGFFRWAGGTSQYAMKNMADGLGVGTKAAHDALAEYRAGEKARLASIDAANQAHRADVLGREDKKQAAWDKYEGLQEKWRESQAKVAEHLGVSALAQGQLLATREGTQQAAKDAALGRRQAAGDASALRREIAMGRQEENERAHRAAEINRRDNLFRLNRKEHRSAPALQTLYGQLTDLEAQHSQKPSPDLASRINALRTQAKTMYDQISSDAASDISTSDAMLSKPDASGVRKYQPK